MEHFRVYAKNNYSFKILIAQIARKTKALSGNFATNNVLGQPKM